MDWNEKIDPRNITWSGVLYLSERLFSRIRDDARVPKNRTLTAYPIPRGGIFAVQALCRIVPTLVITDNPSKADFFIDDIIDSGKTRTAYSTRYPLKPFFVLVDKQRNQITDWVSFPWERMSNEQGPEENIRRIIQHIGDDPNREGLKETPARVVKSYQELFSGYQYKTDEDIEQVLKVFEEGACDEMVILKNIPFFSHCEHHFLGFSGRAHVSYLPDGRIIGLSKLARIVDIFARRLQIQERLTTQVTQTLDRFLIPKGSACLIESSHSCMECRGVRKNGSTMVTSSLTGDFRKPEVRAEFFSLIKG